VTPDEIDVIAELAATTRREFAEAAERLAERHAAFAERIASCC
jgi:hypothetical protein